MNLRSDETTQSFVGGLHWGGLLAGKDAPWPLARLRCTPAGMVLGPSTSLLGFLIPTWRVPWSDVVKAEEVPRGLMAHASVRIYVQGYNHRFTFRHSGPARVLGALALHGVPVEFKGGHFRVP